MISLIALSVLLSGCGTSHAIYLKSGTVCVLEKETTVQASVPDSTGKLVSGTILILPVGTEFKYGAIAK
jgi:hypothetical protein